MKQVDLEELDDFCSAASGYLMRLSPGVNDKAAFYIGHLLKRCKLMRENFLASRQRERAVWEEKEYFRKELKMLREFRSEIVVAATKNRWLEDIGREVEEVLKKHKLIEPLMEDDPEQI